MIDDRIVMGIDIGGTGIKVAPVDVDNGLLIKDVIKMSTPNSAEPAAMLSIIKDIIKEFGWNKTMGCGFPGVIKEGIVRTAANLSQKWLGFNLENKLKTFTSGMVKVLNDADAVALAEMRFGAGKKYDYHGGGIVLVITLGTGIGSALFVDGHLVPNTEFGHMEMSGKEAEKMAATVIREKENLSWEEWGKRVNKFLNYMEMLLSPDLVIIGGGVSENPERFFPYIQLKTKFVAAQMANNAGIIGAALSTVTKF